MNARTALIVDGYNVLLSTDGPYAEEAARDLDSARVRLITDVAAYVHGTGDVVIVFDAGESPRSDGIARCVAGITVVFSPFGVSADSVIEKQVTERRAGGESVTVVTSDAQTQWTVLGSGVTRLSARGFAEEITGASIERKEAGSSGSTRSTIAERVNSEISDQLARWARGEQ